MNGAIDLGIVGLGVIARVQQAVLSGMPALYRLTDACDTDPAKGAFCRAERFYADLNEFLRKARAEAVLISTPPQSHPVVAEACLRAGKHVLLEKPAALHPGEAERMYRTARENGVLLRTAYHAAHGVETAWFLSNRKMLAREYGIGEISAVRCEFYDPYSAGGRLLRDRAPLGGCWIDSGINALSVCARLLDLSAFEPAEREETADRETGVLFRSRRKFRSAAASVEICTAWDTGQDHKATEISFHGSGARLLLQHSLQRVELTAGGRPEILFDGSGEERLTRQYAAVFADYAAAFAARRSDERETLLLQRLLLS